VMKIWWRYWRDLFEIQFFN